MQQTHFYAVYWGTLTTACSCRWVLQRVVGYRSQNGLLTKGFQGKQQVKKSVAD